MPACKSCGTGAAQPIMIHDLTPGSIAVAVEPYCTACLRAQGMFCERHQTGHIWAHNESAELEGASRLMSTCPVCALEVTMQLPKQQRWDIAIALKPQGDVETFIEMALNLGLGWMALLTELDQAVCAVAITAAWHEMSIDAFVEKIAA